MTTTADIWPTFNEWWDAYDYKLDRKRCEKMWNKMSQADKELAMRHTERYVQSTFTDGRFPSRRHPGTYLHNENWHDDALIREPAVVHGGQSIADKKREVLRSFALAAERSGANAGEGNDF